MRLFLKIFLWFWLAMGLIVSALVLVTWWSTQNDSIRRQFQQGLADSIKNQAQTAVQIYENEGEKGLIEFLQRLDASDRISATGFFIDGKQLFAENLPPV